MAAGAAHRSYDRRVQPSGDYRELQIFLALADELHFGRTASRLGLSPGRVSQSISRLERRVGGRLFERTSRQVRITPLGEQLRDALRPAWDQLGQALVDAQQTAAGVAHLLRIATYTPVNLGPKFLAVQRRFAAEHPQCDVQVIDTAWSDCIPLLERREVDLLAIRLPLTNPDLVIGPILAREQRVALVGEGHPLAARESIEYESLADFILGDAPNLPSEMVDIFIPRFTKSGRPVLRAADRNFGDRMTLVATGRKVHITVPSFLDYFSYPGVRAVPITDLPATQTALAWHRSRYTPTVAAFARIVAAEVGLGSPILDAPRTR